MDMATVQSNTHDILMLHHPYHWLQVRWLLKTCPVRLFDRLGRLDWYFAAHRKAASVINIIPDPLHAVREMRRVVKSGGLISVLAPDDNIYACMRRSLVPSHDEQEPGSAG